MYKCKYCGKEFPTSQKCNGHSGNCKANPNYKRHSRTTNYNSPSLIKRDDLFCKYCGKQCKNINSLNNHERRCKENPNYNYSGHKSGFLIAYERGWDPAWNRGLTKETDDRVRKNGESISKYYELPGSREKTSASVKKSINANYLAGCSKGGLSSAKVQQRRSKNEIYFCELCENYFNDVKHNEPMFNGWDADVIIEDIKYAVLWNGSWHYQKCNKKHSLEQVQARDKIKLDQIQLCGYTPYVIKDMGKENPKFVEEQFNIFINSLPGK